MKINLNLLPVSINNDFIIPDDFYKNTDIIKLSSIHAKGIVKYDAVNNVNIILDVDGIMYLPDAYTNDAVEYPFSIQIDEILEENDEFLQKNDEKSQNILDIIEFLWENIVLEVPISYSKEKDVHLSGDGWQLNEEKKMDNSEFMKLDKLFKGGE